MIIRIIDALVFRLSLLGFIATSAISACYAQVSPEEITNPKLRASEQRYLAELTTLNRAIGASRFPMTFRLARYIEARSERAALDPNGIEFVNFHNQVILKISGIYAASFDSSQLDKNGRAIRTFEGAVVPMLRSLTTNLPRSIECDGIGFEVIYGVHDPSPEFDIEGREVLSLVLNRDDAFALVDADDKRGRQQILDRSDAYVSGRPIVLRLGSSQDSDREVAMAAPLIKAVAELKALPSPPTNRALKSGKADYSTAATAPGDSKASQATRLQQEFGTQAKAVLEAESDRLHPDPGMAPQFESEANQIRLHFTARNSLSFEENNSSIYKRAARSFDTFLAPALKSVVNNLPPIAALDAYRFSVLNTVKDSNSSLEVVDYICPVDAMRSFVDDQITSQQLLDKSKVLVNGVRIGINLQLVE